VLKLSKLPERDWFPSARLEVKATIVVEDEERICTFVRKSLANDIFSFLSGHQVKEKGGTIGYTNF